MNILQNWANNLSSGLTSVLFPNVCLGCGQQVLDQGRHICSFCLHKRFDLAMTHNERSSRQIILPEYVASQQALWNYDKGGILQNLLHHLKYQQLKGVGKQLGRVFAKK